MSTLGTVTRRTFLVASTAVAGGVLFGFVKYRRPHANPLLNELENGQAALTPYVRIDTQGITLIAPRAEMGQGVHTTLAALLAEELDVALETVRVEHGPASRAYYNTAIFEEGVPIAQTDEGLLASSARQALDIPAKFLGMQITGGSSSVVDAFEKMRIAGAAARAVLLEAAASELGLDRASLGTADGMVIAPDGRRLSYLELAAAAAAIEPPTDPALKDPSAWRLLGRTQPRVDTPAKVLGRAIYAIDVQLPDMRYATVRMNPVVGVGMRDFDASAALAIPGVERIMPLDGGIAVIATSTWLSFKGAAAVQIEWQAGDGILDSASMFDAAGEAFEGAHDSRLRDDGNVEQALAGAEHVIDAEYRVPYLAHATMEPMNATALLDGTRLDVWVGTQFPTRVRVEAVQLTGLADADVHVHTMLMGGGFGRRLEMDVVKQVIQLAVAAPGVPVKLTWTREEDMQHDVYRPMAIARLRGALHDEQPVAVDLKLAAQSVYESQMGRLGYSVPGPDLSIVQAAWDQPYGIEHYRVTGYRVPAMLPVGSWRSVGASQNGFFHESAIDELAHAAGVDPLAFRLRALTHEPSRGVLEAVAELSGWGTPLPLGQGRGVAFVLSFGVPVAAVIEVAMDDDRVTLLNAFVVVDVGIALDPGIIEAQVQGGLNFGLAAAISGEITVGDGRVRQSNFHDYPVMRMHQAPRRITVRVLERGTRIRGIGEPGTPPAAPALANAIFAASGRRLRELPLNRRLRFG